MPIPNNRTAYPDCFELFDQAVASEHGIRKLMGPDDDSAAMGAARHLRLRLHKARDLDRKANMEVYEETDPKWGTSEYDRFVVRIKQNNNKIWIYIEPLVVGSGVEELGAAE